MSLASLDFPKLKGIVTVLSKKLLSVFLRHEKREIEFNVARIP